MNLKEKLTKRIGNKPNDAYVKMTVAEIDELDSKFTNVESGELAVSVRDAKKMIGIEIGEDVVDDLEAESDIQ